jgi:hypothetical protein
MSYEFSNETEKNANLFQFMMLDGDVLVQTRASSR